jgi:hypothetical protein
MGDGMVADNQPTETAGILPASSEIGCPAGKSGYSTPLGNQTPGEAGKMPAVPVGLSLLLLQS